MDTKERREHARLDFSGIVSLEACSSIEAESADSQATAVDVSESGLCFITDTPVKDKQILKINVPLPGLSLNVPTLGIVMWQKPHNDAYKVGLMFAI